MQTQEQIIAEAKRWRAIYPSYIDSTLKTSQGRRLGKEKCVPYPQLMEISDQLRKIGLQHVVEGHRFYSKDILRPGRIKVKILNDDKKPFNPLILNKLALLKYLAKQIKTIPNRQLPKIEVEPEPQQQQQKQNKRG